MYLDVPKDSVGFLDAEDFLREAWGMFVSYEDLSEEFCVVAKIRLPDGRSVCVRIDRDFTSIYKTSSDGVDTLASWQFPATFRGFRLDELWSNMVYLAE